MCGEGREGGEREVCMCGVVVVCGWEGSVGVWVEGEGGGRRRGGRGERGVCGGWGGVGWGGVRWGGCGGAGEGGRRGWWWWWCGPGADDMCLSI